MHLGDNGVKELVTRVSFINPQNVKGIFNNLSKLSFSH